ncbi:predicted protein [Uncinocarpus reesii 1704]|uniref:Sensitive to high expression protein 9, mitochondrial n=1 Tax=Uncinocarpus reesii (strain UAMH 1704) TaxID=336963 RepID=C4JDC9_UNCRE|nr:uncharacterized protein UREG_00689 [Uncinocarpus reesii 1704]EEP75842.1 predicted protein [Uncinocarpus reesii 1704]
MHPLPLLFRQSLRSGVGFAKTTVYNHIPTASFSSQFARQKSALRNVGPSICLRCQFRAQARYYSVPGDKNESRRENIRDGSLDNDNAKVEEPGASGASTTSQLPNKGPEEESKGASRPGGESDIKGSESSLPSHWENRRSQLSKQFSQLMDNLQSNIFIANRHINDLTGYSAIEKLKQDILAQEDHVRQVHARVRESKDAYSAAINRRSASQREVNELLQRKHAWTPTDLERFTSLYRSDHANERAETEAQEALVAAEREAEEAAALLSKSILSRYHEEQIWSDKIRRMSTWGTWGLMGVNVLLFLIFQVAVEPWRRKRLVKGFEEKVMEALEKENGVDHVPAPLDQKPAVVAVSPITQAHRHQEDLEVDGHGEKSVSSTVMPPAESDISAEQAQPELSTLVTHSGPQQQQQQEQPQSELELEPEPEPITEPPLTTILPPEASLSPDSWQQTCRDLFSDRRVTLSQRDLTTVALESAAAGAAVMGVLIAIFRPR